VKCVATYTRSGGCKCSYKGALDTTRFLFLCKPANFHHRCTPWTSFLAAVAPYSRAWHPCLHFSSSAAVYTLRCRSIFSLAWWILSPSMHGKLCKPKYSMELEWVIAFCLGLATQAQTDGATEHTDMHLERQKCRYR
jgi:hypothetical protein